MTNIGKYIIAGELGVGGFGRVYKAFDPTVGRVVAIKVLNVQDESAVKRFKAEAMTSANLQHKNIVTIHDFQDEGDQQYLVMEFLDGKTLRQILDQNIPMQPLDRLMIMAEVAAGLQYAHEHGVVHRDVKPANIMRLTDGTVKIMDFGIARLVQSGSRDTRLTQTGFIVGTIHYMAPEQFTTNMADAQCDIWAYGVVFYEFLAGTNPFSASSPPQVIYKITAENPPPLSASVPNVPHTLDAILKRLLARSREERYASMEDVRFDLEPVILEMRRGQMDGLLKAADQSLREDRLDDAQSAVRRILELDPSNLQARKWRSQLQEKTKQREFLARVRGLVEQAEAAASQRNFAAAIAFLEEACGLDKGNRALHEKLAELRAEQERVNRAAALLAAAKQEVAREAYTTAFDSAAEAAKIDPRNTEALALVEQLRQAMERRELEARRKAVLSKAKALVQAQSYDHAVEVLQELSRHHPDDPEVRDRLAEALRLQAEHSQRQKAETAVAEGRDLIRRGQYQRGIEILEALEKSGSGGKQVAELLAFAREQLQTEQRAAQVEALIRQASACPAGAFDRTLALLDRALELAPGDEKVLRLRAGVLASRQREEENQAAARAIQECRALALGGKPGDASARLAELKTRYPGHAGVAALEEEITRLAREEDRRRMRETAKREQEKIDAILARVRELAGAKAWDEALAELDQGLAAIPSSTALAQEKERIRERKLAQFAVTEIRQRIARHELDRAISAAQSALMRLPNEGAIAELLRQAKEQQNFEDQLHRAEGLAHKGDIEEAGKLIADLEGKDPANTTVRRLKGLLEEKQKRRQDLATADQFRKRFDFQQARDLVNRLLAEDPDDGMARALLERIEREVVEYDRRQKISMIRSRAAELCKERQFPQAVQLLERANQEFQGETDLQDDLRAARAAWDKDKKKGIFEQGRSELAALMKERRFEDTVNRALQLIQEFPEDPFLMQDLQAARSAIELRDRRLQVDAEIKQLETLFRAGDAAGVRRQAEQVLKKYEEPRARELLAWANKTLAELKDIRRETAPPRRTWLWVVAAVAVLLLVIAIYEFATHQHGAVQFQVKPTELAFIYQIGGPAPGSQSFQVTSKPDDQAWAIGTSDSWFMATPPERTGSGAVSVQVDPSQFTPGEYSGLVTVSSKDGTVHGPPVRIRVKVLAAPVQKPELPKEGPGNKVENPTDKAEGKKAGGPQIPEQHPKGNSEGKVITPPGGNTPRISDEPPVDCHAVDYSGLFNATITWTGVLPPGQAVVLNSRNETVSGPEGVARGTPLPRCAVNIKVLSPSSGIAVSEPGAGNRFAAVTLRNTSSQTLTGVTFRWAIK